MRSAVVLACALVARTALAYDPAYQWRTLETAHFQIHFHQGEDEAAQGAARAAERAFRTLTPLLGHEPSTTQIVISDDTDDANGSATPFLTNTIRLNGVPPDSRGELNDFDEWLWLLVSHEFTHIVHLDTIGGIPKIIDALFGKILAPNDQQPLWFIEGLAVYEESRNSGGGRARSTLEEMQLRAAALEGRLFPIDKLSNSPLEWPRGPAAYLYGGRFLEFIARRHGEAALAGISHDYGRRLIPFALNAVAESQTGESYLEMYDEFIQSITADSERQASVVRAQGETPTVQLTLEGEIAQTPRWRADGGALYYAFHGADRKPELREISLPVANAPPQIRRISETVSTPQVAVAPDKMLIVARAEVFHEYENYQDLWRVDPQHGNEQRLSWGLRASDPDVGPDGTIAFVKREPGGHTVIAARDTASTIRVLHQPPGLEPVAAPRISPSGREVAFVEHQNVGWRIRLLDLASGATRDIAPDPTPGLQQLDPAFSPDGRTLYFSSDRTGISNIYEIDLATGGLQQITNVIAGAFQPAPSPDGKQIAFVTYSAIGYDLVLATIEPRDPLQPIPSAESEASLETRSPEAASEKNETAPTPRPYSPLTTLLTGYRLPFLGVDPFGTTLGLSFGSADVVGLHSYAASVFGGLASRQPGFSLVYGYHGWRIDLSSGLSRDLEHAAGAPSVFVDDTWRGFVGGALPFTTLDHAQELSLRYDLAFRSLFENPDPKWRPFRPVLGRAAALTASWRFASAKRFPNSISAEEGFTVGLSASASDPKLGSNRGFASRLLLASVAHYLRLPFETMDDRPLHHVLALRISGGVGSGDAGRRPLFGLGGIAPLDPLSFLTGASNTSSLTLRGYPFDPALGVPFVGSAVVLGSAEYRFPLWSDGAGLWTLPVYLRRLHAAFFADAGDAFDPHHRPRLKVGVGGELRWELSLAYNLVTALRVGYARGLSPVCGANHDGACNDLFAALGGNF